MSAWITITYDQATWPPEGRIVLFTVGSQTHSDGFVTMGFRCATASGRWHLYHPLCTVEQRPRAWRPRPDAWVSP